MPDTGILERIKPLSREQELIAGELSRPFRLHPMYGVPYAITGLDGAVAIRLHEVRRYCLTLLDGIKKPYPAATVVKTCPRPFFDIMEAANRIHERFGRPPDGIFSCGNRLYLGNFAGGGAILNIFGVDRDDPDLLYCHGGICNPAAFQEVSFDIEPPLTSQALLEFVPDGASR